MNHIRMHQWVKITLKESIRLNTDSGGYKYVLPEYGSSMVKFNVGVHRSFQETMYLTEFGGNESLQKPKYDKIIILFGHDKAIFYKYICTSISWSGCDGNNPLIPKSEEMGSMVSETQSR